MVMDAAHRANRSSFETQSVRTK